MAVAKIPLIIVLENYSPLKPKYILLISLFISSVITVAHDRVIIHIA